MNTKSKSTAILLAFFLGGWGVHRLYVGDKKMGYIMLIAGIIGLLTFIPLIITCIISLFDFIKYMLMSDSDFNQLIATNNGYAQNSTANKSSQSQQNVSSQVGYRFCNKCGNKVAIGTKFCPGCGSSLD